MKTVKRQMSTANRVVAAESRIADNFFSDLQEATIELKMLSKGAPLSSRLVSETIVRKLREKTNPFVNN